MKERASNGIPFMVALSVKRGRARLDAQRAKEGLEPRVRGRTPFDVAIEEYEASLNPPAPEPVEELTEEAPEEETPSEEAEA